MWRAVYIEPADEPMSASTLFGQIVHDDRPLIDAGVQLCEPPVIIREIKWTRARWRWVCASRTPDLRHRRGSVAIEEFKP